MNVCQNLFIAITFQVPEYRSFHTLINKAENPASLLQYLKQLLQTSFMQTSKAARQIRNENLGLRLVSTPHRIKSLLTGESLGLFLLPNR